MRQFNYYREACAAVTMKPLSVQRVINALIKAVRGYIYFYAGTGATSTKAEVTNVMCRVFLRKQMCDSLFTIRSAVLHAEYLFGWRKGSCAYTYPLFRKTPSNKGHWPAECNNANIQMHNRLPIDMKKKKLSFMPSLAGEIILNNTFPVLCNLYTPKGRLLLGSRL